MKHEESSARGVIDRIESDMAVLVLDDGQELDWPVDNLPDDVKPGTAVILSLLPTEGNDGTGPGIQRVGIEISGSGRGSEIKIRYQGTKLTWHGSEDKIRTARSAYLKVKADIADTEKRRRKVADLLDNLFSPDSREGENIN